MWHYADGMGWWMIFGGVWTFIFWGGLIALIVWGISMNEKKRRSKVWTAQVVTWAEA